MAYTKLISKYIFKLVIMIKQVISAIIAKLKDIAIFVPIADFALSLYYYCCCGITPCTVDLDDQTTMHFWIPRHRRNHLPNLVLIHGCGCDSRWQFVLQVRSLSKSFNIFMPDLLFFGKSYTNSKDRSPSFQAKCVMEGLKKGFGVERSTLCGMSYGGWVAYRMAEMYPREVEKVVIVSSGIGSTVDQKLVLLKQIKIPIEKLVIPHNPEAYRLLLQGTLHKQNIYAWSPDFILWEFIKAKEDKYRKEKEELIDHLMSGKADSNLSLLSQEVLLIWGDQDRFFPTSMAYQLQRVLGTKARLEIIKDTGHAVNIDSPDELNQFIKSFILNH